MYYRSDSLLLKRVTNYYFMQKLLIIRKNFNVFIIFVNNIVSKHPLRKLTINSEETPIN